MRKGENGGRIIDVLFRLASLYAEGTPLVKVILCSTLQENYPRRLISTALFSEVSEQSSILPKGLAVGVPPSSDFLRIVLNCPLWVSDSPWLKERRGASNERRGQQ